jgi:thiamine-monophosphate kinase
VAGEAEFIAALRRIANDPMARGLIDDAAVLGDLVLTHDMIVEGVHFLPEDPPADVAWKLVAVNLSDLAGKGAWPIAVLLGYTLSSDPAWNEGFLQGLADVLARFGVALAGGDTVAVPAGTPRTLGLTAIGRAPAGQVPARAGASPGDMLFVAGTIGDAGAGLAIARGHVHGPAPLLDAYRRPVPLLDVGRALAAHVTAMMDVSDGLLIDASRLAEASGVALEIDLDRVPLSPALIEHLGDDRDSRLRAAVAGDDYALLFTASGTSEVRLLGICEPFRVRLTRIGSVANGTGLTLRDRDGAVPLPGRLGYEHGTDG